MKKLFFVLFFCIFLFSVIQPIAQAKTLSQWLEGYDTGEKWFGNDFSYDITDEEACWELLQRPIIILDAGQKEAIYPRQTPNGKRVNHDKNGGFINGASSAVHVLGPDEDGWTLIEGMDYYNRIIRGYVRTRLLKTVTPNSEYGIIIDKLTQTMYVFSNGHLWSSCLVSTGKPNDSQPYNETSAGEYLIVSRVGDFDSEGMICAMGLRYNNGDMIHQVPYKLASDGHTKWFGNWEPLLGSKASHGCIRTQRVPSPEGLNAAWLWDNIKLSTKVVIWDDNGRATPFPDDDIQLYYNPDGGKYYHKDANCSSVKKKFLPMTAFSYSDLDSSSYSALEQCTACRPPLSKAKIAKANYEKGVITKEEYLSSLTRYEYPKDDLQLYYNPKGGKYYHSTANCSSVKSRYLPLTAFSYSDLETESFIKLKACPYCAPVMRRSEIDKANLAMGFDQDESEPDASVPTSSVTISILDMEEDPL